MCEVVERFKSIGRNEGVIIGRNEGVIIGRNEGETRGKEKKAREVAKNFYAMGLSVESIAKGVGYTVDTVKGWLGLAVE